MKHNEKFKSFVDALASLGYAEIDPELKLWHLALNNDYDGMKKLLENPGWDKNIHSVTIPDTEIVSRYANIIRAPWASAKLAEIKSQRRH